MEEAPLVLRLQVVANLVDFVVQVGTLREHRYKVTDKKRSFDCFVFAIVDYLDVHHIHWNVAGARGIQSPGRRRAARN
jgi:hypothetical protein